jgi:hypothetical protein
MARVTAALQYLTLVYIAMLPSLGTAEFFTVASNKYPYVYLSDPVFPVVWHTKFFALKQSSSQAIYISARGIRFIPAAYCTVALTSRSSDTTASLGILPAGGKGDMWGAEGCLLSRQSLCELNSSSDITAHLFPNEVICGVRGWVRIDVNRWTNVSANPCLVISALRT